MTNHVFLPALNPFTTGVAARSESQAHINRLQVSAKAACDQIDISLASIQGSLLLLAEIERSSSLRPVALLRQPPIWWDVYPAVPKSIRLGEIEAADEREAIEKAAKKFGQALTMLIAMRASLIGGLACAPRRPVPTAPGTMPFTFAESPMEPSKKEKAVRHVIDGRRILARQRERVEILARNGHDTTEAKRTLDLFARTLDLFEDDLRKILADERKGADR